MESGCSRANLTYLSIAELLIIIFKKNNDDTASNIFVNIFRMKACEFRLIIDVFCIGIALELL